MFTAPNPPCAGPIDVSVFVQDAETGEPLPATSLVTLTHRDDPPLVLRAEATSAAATNKLLRAAIVDLPRPGAWEVEVTSRFESREARLRFTVEASPARPEWIVEWPWRVWPLGTIALFGLHRLLARRRIARRRASGYR